MVLHEKIMDYHFIVICRQDLLEHPKQIDFTENIGKKLASFAFKLFSDERYSACIRIYSNSN